MPKKIAFLRKDPGRRKKDTKKVNKETKDWRKANYVRFGGVAITLITGAFMNSTRSDTWTNALIFIGLLILIFNLIFVIPDKIVYGKRLVNIK